MIAWTRRFLAIALFARAVWWILDLWLGRPAYGFDEGRPTGLRTGPLTRPEAAAARARERAIAHGFDL